MKWTSDFTFDHSCDADLAKVQWEVPDTLVHVIFRYRGIVTECLNIIKFYLLLWTKMMVSFLPVSYPLRAASARHHSIPCVQEHLTASNQVGGTRTPPPECGQ